jgi:hypothetical protein
MVTFLLIVLIIIIIAILISTFDKWFGTAVFILIVLILIEIGSKEQLPLFTYLIDGIKSIKDIWEETK